MIARGLFHGLLLAVLLLSAIANVVLADTTVSGPIVSDTNWTSANSPYIVTDNVIVMNGVNLTIEPGVTIQFDTNKTLQIDGTLIARGTISNTITFTSNQGRRWGCILFTDSSTDATFDPNERYTGGSILESCVLEYSGQTNYGAVNIESSSPFIHNCKIHKNQKSGIRISGDASPRITKNIISDNSSYFGAGIWVYGLTGNNPTPVIADNVIFNNSADEGGGVYIEGYSWPVLSNTLTFSNNIVCNNNAAKGGGIFLTEEPNYPSYITIENNAILNNFASQAGYGGGIYADPLNYFGAFTLTNNTITRNTDPRLSYMYPSGVGEAGGVFLYQGNSNIQNNNIFTNLGYELYNNSSESSDAYNNWWGTSNESEIEDEIFHWIDDNTRGVIRYSPYLFSPDTNAPISPPTGLDISTTATDLTLKWNPNPEGDVAGYKVYWGIQPAPFFENVTDVNTSLTYTITGPAPSTYYVGVTAYDANYAASNDDPNTIINENQTNGNESWFVAGCFPNTYSTYKDWIRLGRPSCWCGIYGGPWFPYQCDGDVTPQTLVYLVYTADLTVLANNWKKKGGDPTLNPCADFDHKGQVADYRVYTNDLAILAKNWKKKSTQLPGNCPRPE